MSSINIVYTDTALADLQRVASFLENVAPQTKDNAIDAILSGIDMLKVFAEIGTQSSIANMRELYIPFGKSGYAVLYEYIVFDNCVQIVSIKHSKEDKFSVEA